MTEEKELVRWMPRSAKIEARAGGDYEFKFYWAAKNVETTAKGRIVELVPNRKVAYTLASDDDVAGSPPSLVTWTLEEEPDGKTRVTLVHSGIDAALCMRRAMGWGYYLERLAAHCSPAPEQELEQHMKGYGDGRID